jgi:hypothetical protein
MSLKQFNLDASLMAIWGPEKAASELNDRHLACGHHRNHGGV